MSGTTCCPYALGVAQLAERHDEELAAGKNFASGLGRDSWSDLATRLRPRTYSIAPPEDVSPQNRIRDVVSSIRLGYDWMVGRVGVWKTTRK